MTHPPQAPAPQPSAPGAAAQSGLAERIDLLILARLAGPMARPPAPAELRKSLAPLVARALPASPGADGRRVTWDEIFAQRVAALRARGDMTAKSPLAVTETGRARAARGLGVQQVPAWRLVRSRILPALALGLGPDDPVVQRRLSNTDDLRASILRARHELPIPAAPTRVQAMDALILRHIGVTGGGPLMRHLNALRRYLLEQILGDRTRLDLDRLYALMAADAAGSQRRDSTALRDALAQTWLAEAASAPADHASASASRDQPGPRQAFDLAGFARAVQDAADSEHGAGRFGERKVFIAALWQRLCQTPGCADMSADTFKRHLVDANREHLLSLHRADLVQVMDPDLVQASETVYGNATFHFVESTARRNE